MQVSGQRGQVGTAGAYLALVAWHRGLHELAHLPVADLAIMIAGIPAVAIASGWLVAGREPPAIAGDAAVMLPAARTGAA